MEDKAIRGVPWALLSYSMARGITVVTTVVLARLLAPADFGVVALALLAVSLVQAFGGLGLGDALVVRQDLDERAKGTMLTLVLVAATILAGLLAAASPLVAKAFDDPRLTAVLSALAVMVLLSSFGYFYEMVLQRELEFRRRFVANLLQALTIATVSLPLAATGAGVWSLVAGQIAGAAVFSTALFCLATHRVIPAFDGAAARDAWRWGRGFVAQGGFAYLRQNADYIAVGPTLGAAALGFYSMSYRLSEVSYWAVAEPVSRVTFPGFARMRSRGEDVQRPFLAALRLTALVTCPAGVLLSATAEPFTETVLGGKWLPMVGALSVLGIWAAVRPIQNSLAWLLNALGAAGTVGTISVSMLAVVFPGVFAAAALGGITAVAWVVLADIVVMFVLLALLARRRAGVSLALQWRALRPVAVACPATWAAAAAVTELSAGAAPALSLASSLAAGLVTYAAALVIAEPGVLRASRDQIRRTLGRPAGRTVGSH